MKNILILTILVCFCSFSKGQDYSDIRPLEIPVACGLDLKLNNEDIAFMRKYHVKYIPFRNTCDPLMNLRKRKSIKKNPQIFFVYRDMDKKYGDSWRKEINPKARYISEYFEKYPDPSDSLILDLDSILDSRCQP